MANNYDLPYNVRKEKLPKIDRNNIQNVLEIGLQQNFDNVNVQWVSCPDLTKEPFNLAAPGFSCKPALLEVGGVSYLRPNPIKDKGYNIQEILHCIDIDFDKVFIFGSSLYLDPEKKEDLYPLVMNASFPQINNKGIKNLHQWDTINKSRIITVNKDKCSAGKDVLEVRAKEKNSTPFFSGFIDAMQNILTKAYPETLVVLGGVYVPKNGFWKHHPYRNSWEPPISSSTNPDLSDYKSPFCIAQFPEAIITTFSSSTIGEFKSSPECPPIRFTSKIIQCLNHRNGVGESFTPNEDENIEYLGYFRMARTLIRIDEPLI
ncbi:ester hydrolase C11orf54 homolog isoform X2 [Nylanderia fulva]|uniref:ester hydrolase C11orf54 homolog isoform X2 n=1 Tax=Nylanderia fulva TaxID=613905 RepID=UPI0010FB22A4|nr:ester hydrolase C11orf54 homolog isoform X2 [Nylanderia fulva]